MNERIKQLAVQAGMIIGDTSEFDMAKFMPKEQKFAELIVQECAEIALLDGQATGNFETFNKITKHFGVEE